MRAAPGRNSRKSPSCFAASSDELKLTPVTLPPGRLRLATRPSLTGSPPVAKTIGTVVVAALAASAPGVLPTITETCRRSKVGHETGQPVELVVGVPLLDRDVAALDKSFMPNPWRRAATNARPVGRRATQKSNHRHRRLLRARHERPPSRAAKRGYEFSPSDLDCHVTLQWGSCPCNGGTIPRFDRAVLATSRLEGPPSFKASPLNAFE